LARGRGGIAGIRAARPSHRAGAEAQGEGTVVPGGVSRGPTEVIGRSLSVGKPLGDFEGFLHRIRPPQMQEPAAASHGE
jgi:hypothetical protein